MPDTLGFHLSTPTVNVQLITYRRNFVSARFDMLVSCVLSVQDPSILSLDSHGIAILVAITFIDLSQIQLSTMVSSLV